MLVESLSEIEANVDTLIQAIHSDSKDRALYADLVKKGAIFYPFQFGDILAFAPSRFIGYKNNDIENHKNLVATGVAHGSYTSARITSILGYDCLESQDFDAALSNYCEHIGVSVEGKRHKFWINDRVLRSLHTQQSAIDDLNADDVGNPNPERKQATGSFFIRNIKVRLAVLSRADGKCEFCGEPGFLRWDDTRYIEAHHIIGLAKQGPDTLDNVIALCPNHHREAHYGKDRQQLEIKLMAKLVELRSN